MTSCNIENDMDTENRRLLNTDKRFAKMSVEQGAAEAFRHFLTEDAMGMAPNQHPVMGREKLYEDMSPGQSLYVLGWTWGTYTLTGKNEQGGVITSHGKYLNIWERQADGQWLVVVDMGNLSPAPG